MGKKKKDLMKLSHSKVNSTLSHYSTLRIQRPNSNSKNSNSFFDMVSRCPRAIPVDMFNVQEVSKVVNEANYIVGVSAVMLSITLVGLTIGFVLLRVESLVEEGFIKNKNTILNALTKNLK